MKIAFLYGGQGSQREAMGRDFYENFPLIREFYDSIDYLDLDLKEISFKAGEEEIKRTDLTQPLIVAYQIAITKQLISEGIKPDYLAGLSIGEYSALYAAGVLSEKDTLMISRHRGLIMEKLSRGIDTAMLAVLGLSPGQVELVCKSVSKGGDLIEISNLNSPGQVIISGSYKGIERAKDILDKKGAKRLIELEVGGPFHTSYMEGASYSLRELFRSIDFKPARLPIFYNLTGSKETYKDIKETMCQQVMKTVDFHSCLEAISKEGIDLFIEIGSRSVIKGLLKRVNRSARIISLEKSEDLEELIREVRHARWKKTS